MITQPRSYSAVVLADAPVNYWRLNDVGATVVDAGSAAKNGTFTAGITTNMKGMFCPVDNGQSLGTYIPHTADYVQVASITALSASSLRNNVWSFECWVRPRAITSDTYIYGRADLSSAIAIRLHEVSGQFTIQVLANFASLTITSTGITDLNRWHHIVVVSTDDLSASGELIIYLNGVALTNGSFTASGALSGNTSNIQLGAGFSSYIVMSEVAIYSTALSAAQVLAHYKAASLNYRPRFKATVGLHADTMYESSSGERTTVLANHGTDGAKIARHTLLWEIVEPTEGATKDWSRSDDIATKSAAAGVETLFMISASPTWANGGATRQAIPTNGAAFTTFVGKLSTFMTAAVNRYKTASGGRPRISKWEIWNEPNFVASWNPTPSAAQYIEMANTLRTAILAEDPTAEVAVASLGSITVVGGAPDLTGDAFLTSLLTAGTPISSANTNYSIHTYSEPTGTPKVTTAFGNNFADIWRALDILKINGRLTAATRIWLTEFGWSTDSVSEANQALYIEQALGMIRDYYSQWVEMVLVFCDISDTGGRGNYGIRGVTPTYTAKAARAEVLRYGSN